MNMHFTPYVQAGLDELAKDTGCSPETLVNDMLTERLIEQAEVRQTLDRRYDDIKSGRVALIDGEESRARFREKHKARRAKLV
jgi:hypothetical protein